MNSRGWVAAGLGALLAVAGCGDASGDRSEPRDLTSNSRPGPGPVAFDEVSPAARENAEQARVSYERWAGSLADHRAEAVISAWTLNGAKSDCMDAKGAPQRYGGWEKAIGGVTADDFYFQGVAALYPPVRTLSYAPQVNALPDRLTALRFTSPPEPYDTLLTECLDEVNAGRWHDDAADAWGDQARETETSDLGRATAAIEQLHTAWTADLLESTEDVATNDEVGDCLAGVELGEPFGPGGPNAWGETISKAQPIATQVPPDGSAPAAPQWQRFLDLEETFLSALWGCHADTYDEATGRLPDVVEEFEAEHAELIARAEGHWRSVRARATQLGWAEERPLAGLTAAQVDRWLGELTPSEVESALRDPR